MDVCGVTASVGSVHLGADFVCCHSVFNLSFGLRDKDSNLSSTFDTLGI